MSGKYVKKETKKKKSLLPVILVILCLAALAVALWWIRSRDWEEKPDPTVPADTAAASDVQTAAPEETQHVQVDAVEEVSIDLGNGMRIVDVGRYTGVYMEDGSDEIVSGVMMIAVVNEGEDAIQYAEITMPAGSETAVFSLTTLPPGATVILLEQNRMEYEAGSYPEAVASNVAQFQEPLSLCEDQLEIQILNGAINVSNISGGDITGDIVIYYKNSAADVYYGGITYRVRLEGGLKTDEIRQIMASHFSESGSTIMFVTCGDA